MRKIIAITVLKSHQLGIDTLETVANGMEAVNYPKKLNYCHPDFTEAWEMLKADLAVLAEQFEMTAIEDNAELLGKFVVDAIQITDKLGIESLTIFGRRLLSHNKELPLKVDVILEQDSSHYAYLPSLLEKLERIMSEGDQYLNGKESQLGLFDSEAQDNLERDLDGTGVETATKTRKRKARKKKEDKQEGEAEAESEE